MKRHLILSLTQLHKLLLKAKKMSSKSISNYWDFAIVMLIVMAGLRIIEAARADVTDIKDGYLSIQGKRHSSKDKRVELFSFDFYAEIRNHHLLLCNHIYK